MESLQHLKTAKIIIKIKSQTNKQKLSLDSRGLFIIYTIHSIIWSPKEYFEYSVSLQIQTSGKFLIILSHIFVPKAKETRRITSGFYFKEVFCVFSKSVFLVCLLTSIMYGSILTTTFVYIPPEIQYFYAYNGHLHKPSY